MATIIGYWQWEEPHMDKFYWLFLRDARGFKYKLTVEDTYMSGVKDFIMCAEGFPKMTIEEFRALPDKI